MKPYLPTLMVTMTPRDNARIDAETNTVIGSLTVATKNSLLNYP